MASPSSSSSSSAAKSQPLHNFELSPLLKWNGKDGRYARNPKRCRSMKSPPHHRPHSSPLRRSPPRDFTVGVPRFQTHLMREPRATLPPPPPAAEDERKDPAIDGEFERMSLIQEENLRHYRGRDWWSESEKSDVIAYRRNPMKKSGFSPAKYGSSSNSNSNSNPDGRRSDAAAGDFEVHRRDRYSWFSNSDVCRSNSAAAESFRNHFKKPTFTFNSESKAAESNKSLKKYAISSSSNSAADENPRKKSGFSSPKKQHSFSNVEEKKPKAAEKTPLKKTGFSSPKKHSSSSNAEDKKKSMAAEADAVVKDKEKRSNPADADASPKRKSSSSPLELQEKRVDEKKPKEEANPKILPLKKSAFFGKLDKSKAAAAAAAATAAKECEAAKLKTTDSKRGKEEEKKKKKKEKEKEKDDKDDGDFDEEIKVWNLRPRNVMKSKAEKPNGGGGGGGGSSKSKARSSAAKAAGAGGGGEKKEKKKPLSIAISLTKQEIEEDIFALTGAKPSRRPKKRPKNVQKQLDSVFPGLYLVSITPESYKVSENSLKG